MPNSPERPVSQILRLLHEYESQRDAVEWLGVDAHARERDMLAHVMRSTGDHPFYPYDPDFVRRVIEVEYPRCW